MRSLDELIAHPDAIWLLQERLQTIRGDIDEALAIRQALVSACFAGGDRVSGRRHLEDAWQQAHRMGRLTLSHQLRQQLGLHLLSIGLTERALPHLTSAMQQAIDVDDTLMIVALGVSLSALHLEEEDWAEAHRMGTLVVAASSRRGNWLGVADGLITQSTCMLATGEPLTDAIALLLHGGHHLNKHGAAAAVNLIKARLGELRATHTPALFDAFLRQALAQLGSQPAQAT